MRARVSIVLCLLGLASLAGCSSTRTTKIQDAPAKTGIETKKGQKIVGYVARDGSYHEYKHGYVRSHPPDTLEFWQREWDWDGREGDVIDRFFVHKDSVYSIEARHSDTAKTVFGVVAVTAFLAVAVIGLAVASSCPFLYSYDGEQYVLDAEPYGGATMRALERNDWSEMEHLVPVNGSYRILATNEMDETQHTNRLSLLVVDHAPGTTVVVDLEGQPHAFARLAPPSSARDERGTDLVPWLRERDEVAWYPDLEAFSRQHSIEDTRNHVSLEFPRPVGTDRAHLVAHVSTGPWGSHMLREMLRVRGKRVRDFYGTVNSSALARGRLHDWNLREEVFLLALEVETARGWERQGFLIGGGPVIGESRAIPIDLSGVEGPIVRVRVHPPIGFWSLNSFHLASDERPVSTRELAPVSARQPSGRDVLAAIRQEDGHYLDFPEYGNRAEILFDAPESMPGTARTVFACTRGWYEIHLRDLGPPDAERVTRLMAEPGYPVRMALEEFREFQATGTVVGAR